MCESLIKRVQYSRENQIAIYSDSAVGFYHDEKNMPKGGVPDIVVVTAAALFLQ